MFVKLDKPTSFYGQLGPVERSSEQIIVTFEGETVNLLANS